MKRKFWNWIKNEDESVPDMERTLFLNGMISDETWYGDEVTPQLFKDELNAGNGNITVWINSPGGDVFAAAQIYNMLRDYKGKRDCWIATASAPFLNSTLRLNLPPRLVFIVPADLPSISISYSVSSASSNVICASSGPSTRKADSILILCKIGDS